MVMNYRSDEPGSPPNELYGRILAAIDSPSPVDTRTTRRISIVLAAVPLLSALVVTLASYLVYGRPAAGLELEVRSIERLWLALGLFGTLTLAATYFALAQGRNGFGTMAAVLIAIVFLITPVYTILIVPAPLHASGTVLEATQISPWGVRCLSVASVVIALALACFLFALRRAVPVSVRLRAAALGAAAGAWAGLALLFFCPAAEWLHLLIGHSLPVLVATLLGALVAPTALRT
jgi:hypothetical protein